MQPFNFIQARLLERNLCRDYLNRQARLIGLLLVLSATLVFGLLQMKTYIRERTARVGSRVSTMQAQANKMQDRLKRAESHIARYEWEENLAAETRKHADTIRELARCTPKDIWLSQVQSTSDSSVILVSGSASSYASISAFTTMLRCSPTFSEVNLGDVKTVRSTTAETMLFQVKVSLSSAEKKTGSNASAEAQHIPALGGGA